MTETQTGQGQSVNGQAATLPPDVEPDPVDTGERWLGILVIAAGAFLLLVGIDRVSGGRFSAGLGGGDASG